MQLRKRRRYAKSERGVCVCVCVKKMTSPTVSLLEAHLLFLHAGKIRV